MANITPFEDFSEIYDEWFKKNKDKSHFYNIAEFFSTEEVLACLSETGFGSYKTKQTIFPGKDTQHIENDFGTGSFVVIKGLKINQSADNHKL